MSFLRGMLFLAITAFVSWHFLVRAPAETPTKPTPVRRVELAVAPKVEEQQPEEKAPEDKTEEAPPGAGTTGRGSAAGSSSPRAPHRRNAGAGRSARAP